MFAGMKQAAGMAQVATAPPPEWSTRIGQCDPPATGGDWAFACFCFWCAQASAKSAVDKSDVCFNCLCWQPIATYSYVRNAYGIKGTCGDDMGCGTFCMPCVTRRIVTESRIKGALVGPYGNNSQDWHSSMFDCGCCDFFEALICPFCVAHEIRGYLQPSVMGDCCFDVMCLVPCSMYGQTRHNFGIRAEFGCIEDVLAPIFCWPCVINRARRECKYQIQNPSAHHAFGMGMAAMGARQGTGHGVQTQQQQQQQAPPPKKKGLLPF